MTVDVAWRELTRSPNGRRAVRLGLVIAIAAGSVTSPAVAATAPVGTLSTFAGGVGWGTATNVGQSAVGVGMLGDRVLEVDGWTMTSELPALDGHYPTVVRAIDVLTGLESVVAGHEVGGFSADGSRAVGSSLSGARTAVGDANGNVYLGDNNRLRKITASGIITTIAGTGTSGFSGDGGPATSAELDGPHGVALASDGSILFSDTWNGRIRRIDTNGVITTVAGSSTNGSGGDGGPATLAPVNLPRDIGFDAAGNLYIAEGDGDRIRMVNPAGTISTFARTRAQGMAVAGVGRVLVTDGTTIRSIDVTGTATIIAGTEGVTGFSGDGGPATKAQLSGPRGVTVDRAGNVYVADSGNRRVRMVDTTGLISTIAGNGSVYFGGDGSQAVTAQMAFARLVRTGPYGTYISHDSGHIRHVDPAGVIRTVRMSAPAGMAVDSEGNLYLSEGPRVVKRTPAGTVAVVAGNGDASRPTGDGGPATEAGLAPGSLAVDGSGNLYIAEQGENTARIRRVDTNGVISTVAGADPVGEPHRYPKSALHAPISAVDSMAVGPDGALYVLTTGEILRISCGVIGQIPVDAGIDWDHRGYGAQDLAVDSAGNLFISTVFRVYRVTPEGRWTVVAGGGTTRVAEGLPATSAKFDRLRSLALDDAGNLYLTNLHRVLKVAGVSAGAASPGPWCDSTPPPAETGASYQPLAPGRVLDTRNGTGGYSKPVGPNATISLGVTGTAGVPVSGVSAVVLNVTVTEPSAGGFLNVFPSGTARPLASSVNFRPGQTVANLVVAKVGNDGGV
ncbi:MAG: NHL repeat-containing protein, partial [Actinomycetota bacterium]|nr:NHL repeat-containing protein [Actinomycetota bacterium]